MQNGIVLLTLVLLPMVCAVLCFIIGRKSEAVRDMLAVLTAAAELVAVLCACFAGELELALPGICGLGLGFEMDGFRKVYCVMVAVVWLMTTLFSREYFRSYHARSRYCMFNLLTLGATMGVFLSADLYTTFVFFEIMSFTSYEWVAHDEEPEAIRAANTYLGVAVIGGLVALMGLFLLHNRLGTLTVSRLYEASLGVDRSLLYLPAACLLFGFGAKAGMFPLHIWLPKAHPIAPAPASAILSGILTKSGVFGILAVTCNLFRGDAVWGTVILVLGCVTMVLGAVLALLSINLKRTLACSSVSQIGFILVGTGMLCLLGEENLLAARGTLLHMVNHSALKLVLFTAAGAVYMQTHELDLNRIRGFGRGRPFLNAVFLMGALGIVGVPGWNGYISKTLLHESIVEYVHLLEHTGGPAGVMKAVEWVFLISGGLTAAYMAKLYITIFIEKNPERRAEFESMPKRLAPATYAALGLPALLLVVLGVAPYATMDRIADLGSGFFAVEAHSHVRYFAAVNLKGTVISLGMGAAVYLAVVRTLLMKRTASGREHKDILPEWLDLEDGVYRPLCRGVMAAGSLLLRIVKDVPDALVLALADTVFRLDDTAPQDINVKKGRDRIGHFLDRLLGHGHSEDDEDADHYMRVEESLYAVTKKVTRNLSFALLVCCAGIFGIMLYLLIIGT